jgi:hypothetical protein
MRQEALSSSAARSARLKCSLSLWNNSFGYCSLPGKVSVVVQIVPNGRGLKSGYEEGYFRTAPRT